MVDIRAHRQVNKDIHLGRDVRDKRDGQVQRINDVLLAFRLVIKGDGTVLDLDVVDREIGRLLVFFRFQGKGDEIIEVVMVLACPDQMDNRFFQLDLFDDRRQAENRLS